MTPAPISTIYRLLVCSFNTTFGGCVNSLVNTVGKTFTVVDTKVSTDFDNDDDTVEGILVVSISVVVTENISLFMKLFVSIMNQVY